MGIESTAFADYGRIELLLDEGLGGQGHGVVGFENEHSANNILRLFERIGFEKLFQAALQAFELLFEIARRQRSLRRGMAWPRAAVYRSTPGRRSDNIRRGIQIGTSQGGHQFSRSLETFFR